MNASRSHSVNTLCALLRSSVEGSPDRIAVRHKDRDLTYGELGRRARVLAQWFLIRGVSPGNRVVLILPNSIDYVVAHFGVLLAGGCIVALNPELASEEIVRVIQHCEAVSTVVTPKIREMLAESSLGPGILNCTLVSAPPGTQSWPDDAFSLDSVAFEGDAAWPPEVSPDDLAQIIYTSGTTGRSKGVTLQHRALVANCLSIVSFLRLSAVDSMFVTLPFYYSYGLSLLLTHVAVGGRLVLADDFVFLGRALDMMRDQRATGFAGVPSSYAMLIHKSDFLTRSFPDLRYMTCAGGAMSPDIIALLRRTFPNVELYLMYGQTEASARLSMLLPHELDTHPGSIGRGIPGVQLLVMDDQGMPVAPDTVGEIVARGENVMAGYWRDDETTARVLRPEGLRTGDLATWDTEGYIYIVGRKSDIIKCGAYRIGPQEIEDVILQQSDVAEVAVVGKPDELLGEVPVAFVVLTEPSDASRRDELLRFANHRLSRYMALRDVHFVDGLPKTSSGKILRRLLRERVLAEEHKR